MASSDNHHPTDGSILQSKARVLVPGIAHGKILYTNLALSFWGGVSPSTGEVIDRHHPLCGSSIAEHVLVMPSGRGSCSGSGVLLQLLLSDRGPAALIFQHVEQILALGVLVAQFMFQKTIPVVVLGAADFDALENMRYVQIRGDVVCASKSLQSMPLNTAVDCTLRRTVKLSAEDEAMLQGEHGQAAQVAMEILLNFAEIQRAERLLDVTRVHIDACVYTGAASLKFATNLVSMGAKVVVPTTLNSISVDYRRWKELGISTELAVPAKALADAYVSMNAKTSFTCAPYLLDSPPKLGEEIGWAESNAVVFANSVLGARTQKYPDFLDVCMALTGRAPLSGCHIEMNRQPSVIVHLPTFQQVDDSLFPVVGYLIGKHVGPEIPFVRGLEETCPRISDLKAFGAAFATTASAPMFHIRGVTPESSKLESTDMLTRLRGISITHAELDACHKELNTATDHSLGLVSLGNPHFSSDEFVALDHLCKGRRKHPQVNVVVTTSRLIQEEAERAGHVDSLITFGVIIITDTCWCMLEEPVVPLNTRNLMTNSAKYAHYAPGMVQRGVHFGSLEQCVEAACTGSFQMSISAWAISPETS